MRKAVRFAATAGITFAMSLLGTGHAGAQFGDFYCDQDQDVCFYYNSNHKGAVSTFEQTLDKVNHAGYTFKGSGLAGVGTPLKNNAASAWHPSQTDIVRVYFNSGCTGEFDTFYPGNKKNLVKTYNDNASHCWYGAG